MSGHVKLTLYGRTASQLVGFAAGLDRNLLGPVGQVSVNLTMPALTGTALGCASSRPFRIWPSRPGRLTAIGFFFNDSCATLL